MATIKSIAIQTNPTSLQEFETFDPSDLNLLNEFEVNGAFNFDANTVEVHIYSPTGQRLISSYDHKNIKRASQELPEQETGGTRSLLINPIEDAEQYGYKNKDVKVLYHFLDNLYSVSVGVNPKFFIHTISNDRKEIFAVTKDLAAEDLISDTEAIKRFIEDPELFFDFRLNFAENDLFLALNLQTYQIGNDIGIKVKLYKPLPSQYTVKSVFKVVEKVADSVLFDIESDPLFDLRNLTYEECLAIGLGPDILRKLFPTPPQVGSTLPSLSLEGTPADRGGLDGTGVGAPGTRTPATGVPPTTTLENILVNGLPIDDLVNQGLTEDQITSLRENAPINNIGEGTNKYSITDLLTFNSSPNFDSLKTVDFGQGVSTPTEYLSIEDLFGYEVENNNYALYAQINKKGIDLNINYSDFEDFVHFGSAEERVRNFKYKLDLVQTYEHKIAEINSSGYLKSGITGSLNYYQNLIKGIISNFDHYDRHLFFESGSTSWPKSTTKRPHVNLTGSAAESISFFNTLVASASVYDYTNNNSLTNTIPAFLREDPDNNQALIFTHMLGQHFDNVWIYGKAVTDKYDADNRINFGVSREIVGELLKNFGVNIFNSKDSLQELFKLYAINQYDSGSINEQINTLVSPTGVPTSELSVSFDKYSGEILKRIYHNLPILLKSKGTERAIKVLVNTFGIPKETILINYQGGTDTRFGSNYGNNEFVTGSENRIRIEAISNLAPGNTLSEDDSIRIPTRRFTRADNVVDFGFDINQSINDHINENLGLFTIDDYIGDFNQQFEGSYNSLRNKTDQIFYQLNKFNVKDFIRILKFFDASLFKLIDQFIPGRVKVEKGIIIRPSILNRSKFKSPSTLVERLEYSGSLRIGAITGSDGKMFGAKENFSTSFNSSDINTSKDVARYNGELSGSIIKLTQNGDLTRKNTFRTRTQVPINYSFSFISASQEVTFISGSVPTPPPPPPPAPFIITGDLQARPGFNVAEGAITINSASYVSMSMAVVGGSGLGFSTTARLDLGFAGLDFDSYDSITAFAQDGATVVTGSAIPVPGNYIYRLTIVENAGTTANTATISGSLH